MYNFSSCAWFKAIVFATVISSENLNFHNYQYPMWATVLGWMLSLSSVSAIPIVAAIYWIKKLRAGPLPQAGASIWHAYFILLLIRTSAKMQV